MSTSLLSFCPKAWLGLGLGLELGFGSGSGSGSGLGSGLDAVLARLELQCMLLLEPLDLLLELVQPARLVGL